jgi:hypothetical protein
MGYTTRYNLKVELTVAGKVVQLLDEGPLFTVIEELRQHCEEARYSLNEDGDDAGNESRWYEHCKDMKEFSALHPNILFTIHGEGEETGDLWTEYFLGGKCQVAKAEVKIAPFDPKKLT